MYPLDLQVSFSPAQPEGVVRDATVGEVLRDAAGEMPESEALVEVRADGSRGRTWNFRELLADAERLADALLTRFAPGERIAIWAPNAPEWVLLEFAAGMAGLTLVTVNPAYQAKELAYVLRQSRSAGLFLVKECRGNPLIDIAGKVCAELPSVREIVDIEDGLALFARGAATHARPQVLATDPVQVQYTSGTTGFPKGAVLSHRNLTNNARFSLQRLGLRAGDGYLGIMPLFHTAGCSIAVLGCVQLRCRLVLMRLFEPGNALLAIERERVNALTGVPTMLIAMLEAHAKQPRELASLRVVLSGGAMVAPELVARIESTLGCGFTIIYGQTESSPGLTQTRADDPFELRVGTIGQAYPHTDMSIRDPASNAVVAIGAIGEICARGYCVMLGYNDNPDATAHAIDSDGWLHTGDLGTMDAQGFVRITGRVKDMIIRGGENIFPAEVENVLIAHPAVAEVAVVGVPDPYWGEIGVAFLRLRPGASASAEEFVRHVRAELAAPKTPARWIVLDAFPLTGSGKIQKFVLRDRYVAGDFAEKLL